MVSAAPLVAVVDDEESVRSALRRLFKSAGMRVMVFATGAEFLASLARGTPDCVVLDLHMSGMGGLEVQARLRASVPQLPVIVLTGYDTPESQEHARAGGAVAYLTKPVDGQALLDAVAMATRAQGAGK